jgi:hypothetical protein
MTAAPRTARRRARTALLLAVGLALGGVGTIPMPAGAVQAQPNPRRVAPVRAGSVISRPQDGGVRTCTAGPVLEYAGVVSRFSAYNRAIRYVLTAKHCYPMDSQVTLASTVPGKVVWQSATDDVELIEVLPLVRTSAPYVDPRTGVPVHGRLTTYTPRAVNDVFTATSPHLSWLRLEHLHSAARPAQRGDMFVNSGHAGGVFDGWSYEDVPPADRQGPNEASGFSALAGIGIPANGDSGGPVYAADGATYGVLSGDTYAWGVSHMFYTRMDGILRQLGGRYREA